MVENVNTIKLMLQSYFDKVIDELYLEYIISNL